MPSKERAAKSTFLSLMRSLVQQVFSPLKIGNKNLTTEQKCFKFVDKGVFFTYGGFKPETCKHYLLHGFVIQI